MSDFLQFVDEVIDGQPEYNVTQKPNGKYDIELANTIVQEGTPLIKAGLNILNSVLGYNLPTYSQEEIENINDYTYNDMTLNYNAEQEYLSETISNIGKIILNDGNVVNISAKKDSNTSYTIYNRNSVETYFLKTLDTSTANSGCITNSKQSGICEIYFDTKIKLNTLTYSCGNTSPTRFGYFKMTFYDNDIQVYTFTENSNQIKNKVINNIGIFNKIEIELTNNWSTYIAEAQVQFTDFEVYNQNYLNKYVVDYNIENFSNNQRCLIQTSNDVSIEKVFENTLNNIEIDTILQPNKYYELLYDETNDKFIAQEVRTN